VANLITFTFCNHVEPGLVSLENFNDTQLITNGDVPVCRQAHTNGERQEFCSISPHIPITIRSPHFTFLDTRRFEMVDINDLDNKDEVVKWIKSFKIGVVANPVIGVLGAEGGQCDP